MFINRNDAAQQLCKQIDQLSNKTDIVILAIPRGGLPIGAVLARHLHAPLGVVFTKKIGAPFNPELAIGAVSINSAFVAPAYNRPELQSYLQQEIPRLQTLLKQRAQLYHAVEPPIIGKNVIIVDDGIATGHTMLAAITDIKQKHPKTLMIAAPVIAQDTQTFLQKHVHKVISVLSPSSLGSIGEFYQHFEQLSDKEACHILNSYLQS